MSVVPKSLDELGDGLELWEELHNDLQATEDRIPPIHDQFAILEKYEVPVPEEVWTFIWFYLSFKFINVPSEGHSVLFRDTK